MRNIIVLFMLVTGLLGCGSTRTMPIGDRPVRILVFSKTSWYRHDAIPKLNEHLIALAREQGWEAEATEDGGAFTPDNLARFDAVVFNNTTDIGKSLDDAQKRAFTEWFRKGGGYVGLHAASVHHKTWDWYHDMLGCDFNSDTERQPGLVSLDPEAQKRKHPAARGLPRSITIAEEWMHYDHSLRGKPGTTVLLTLDESTIDTTVKPYFRDKGGLPMGGDHPISWVRQFEDGRVFYTNFGHDVEPLETDFGRRHILAGLRWVIGLE